MDVLAISLDDAVNRADVDEVKHLLSIGADPNAVDGKGWTPLMSAAWVASIEVVTVLIEAGAHVQATNWDGLTAADLARSVGHDRYGHKQVVDFFESMEMT